MEHVTAHCVCGSIIAEPKTLHDLPMLRCSSCDVIRQDVRMSHNELAEWYRTRYFGDDVYYHTYDHDRSVARMRLDAYDIDKDAKLLDVGAGRGAFVDECVSQYIDAWGQDLADESNGRTWVGDLYDVAFPAHRFDVVTMHDVLEHVPDPVDTLTEIARTLRPGGRLIVDFPRFHHESGVHHWKAVEHLWMLTDDQLTTLVKSCGFEVERVEHPIPSKTVVYAVNGVKADEVKILVPPGLGDGYWVLAKLRGILDEYGLYLPQVYVHDNGPHRAGHLWDQVPFVRFAGYGSIPLGCPERRLAYYPPGQVVQRDVHGFDFFISFNGTMDAGQSLNEAVPGPIDWYEPLFIPKSRAPRVEEFRASFDEYVVVSFWDKGFYSGWLKHFTSRDIVKTLRHVADQGRTVVVMGAEWDKNDIGPKIAAADHRFVDLVGGTTYDDMIALVSGASLVFGHPAGNTMMGSYLRRPTALLWGNHFPPAFRHNACPSDGTYVAIDVERNTPHDVIRILEEIG